LPYGEVRLEKEWRDTSDAASYVVSFDGATVAAAGRCGRWKEKTAISCLLKQKTWLLRQLGMFDSAQKGARGAGGVPMHGGPRF